MARALLGASLLLALVAMSTVSAHTCLTYPMMRGPHPDLFPGDPVCYQRTGNCGNLPKGAPTATFIQNVPTTITFQQNLNHFWQPNPGHFDVSVSYDNESSWQSLLPNGNISDFPANNMNTQTWFNVPVVFTTVSAEAVVRVRYVSHNQDEVVPNDNTEAIFYSCSDVEVREQGKWGNGAAAKRTMPVQTSLDLPLLKNHRPAELKREGTATASGNKMCKTPKRFVSSGVERDFQGSAVMNHNIAYDTVSGWVKWERSNTQLGGAYSMTDFWNLTFAHGGYTPQYIYGLNGPNTCSLYGGDRFFPWEYGAQVGMDFLGNTSEALFDIMSFSTISSGVKWMATVAKDADFCLPYNMQQGTHTTLFNSVSVESFPAGTFTPPAVCTTHMLPNAGCWADRLKNQQK